MASRRHRDHPVGRSPSAAELFRERLQVRVWRSRLDRDLADGCPPDGSDLLASRARQLADPLTRHELAILLRRVVADAEHPSAELSPVAVRRAAVVSSREGLLGLAERLEGAWACEPVRQWRAQLVS